MTAFDGSLARSLDFGDTRHSHSEVGARAHTRIASRSSGHHTGTGTHVLPWRGSDTYRVLEHRRRQAQIKARQVLAALEHHDEA